MRKEENTQYEFLRTAESFMDYMHGEKGNNILLLFGWDSETNEIFTSFSGDYGLAHQVLAAGILSNDDLTKLFQKTIESVAEFGEKMKHNIRNNTRDI